MSSSSSSSSSSLATSNLWQNTRFFIAGQIGGMAGAIAGQPFDTIKIRLQTDSKGKLNNMFHAFRVMSRDGISVLYRGLEAPLLMVGIQKAVAFGSYGTAIRYITGGKITEASQIQVLQAAIFGGFCNAFLVSPVDQLKIGMQVQKGASSSVTSFPHMFRALVKDRGWFQGLYGDLPIVISREIVGYGIYFSVFHYLNTLFADPNDTEGNRFMKSLLIGGSTGTAMWGLYYPIDVIKSTMQADRLAVLKGKTPKSRSLLQTVSFLFNTKGFGGFYQGWLAAVCRAFPAHAAVLSVYSYLMKHLPYPPEE